ncbi:MAG: hypothetical protein ABIZ05_10225 [Pseudonocardiaceae bacterium]
MASRSVSWYAVGDSAAGGDVVTTCGLGTPDGVADSGDPGEAHPAIATAHIAEAMIAVRTPNAWSRIPPLIEPSLN